MRRIISLTAAALLGLAGVATAAPHSSWENAADGWVWNGGLGVTPETPVNAFSPLYATHGTASLLSTVQGVPSNGYFTVAKNFPSVTDPAQFYQTLRFGGTVQVDYTVVKTADGVKPQEWSEIMLAWVGDDGVGAQNIPYAELKVATAGLPAINQPLSGTATFNITPKDDAGINASGGFFGLFLGYNFGHGSTGFTGDVGTFNLYFDNFRVAAIPEPASLGALAITGLALLRRRG
jgi:hypothetical protein